MIRLLIVSDELIYWRNYIKKQLSNLKEVRYGTKIRLRNDLILVDIVMQPLDMRGCRFDKILLDKMISIDENYTLMQMSRGRLDRTSRAGVTSICSE